MTEVYRFSETEFLLFSLVLVRMSAFVVSWPVFGVELVSHHLKILFALMLTMIIFPTLHWTNSQIDIIQTNLVLLAIKEAFVGLCIGFLARGFFFTFRAAGEMISQAMGLNAASFFNPAVGGQTTAIEQFYTSLATLFYLAANGHHYLISGLVRSLNLVPVAQLSLNVSQFPGVGLMVQEIVELGLKFSAPVVISILVINLILGVVGKTVPQLNVLVTSFPINIMVGLLLMSITLPLLMDRMGEYLEFSTTQIFKFVRSF